MSSSSSHAISVEEEPWHRTIESQIYKWRQTAHHRSNAHKQAGYHYKRLKLRYGLLPVLLPVLVAPFSELLRTHGGTYIHPTVLALVGVFNGLLFFFAPGEAMKSHFNSDTRFSDIKEEIDLEVARYREFRTSADMFLMKIKMMMRNVTKQEDPLPYYIEQKIPDVEGVDFPLPILDGKQASAQTSSKKSEDLNV